MASSSRSGASRSAVIAVDQGSSHTRAVVFDAGGRSLARTDVPIRTEVPTPDRVEQDPEALLGSVFSVLRKALRHCRKIRDEKIPLGIANQRSTFICWDQRNGKPVAPAISWQDRRTADRIERWERNDFLSKTGLPLTPYYSATKLAWLLDRFRKEKRSLRNLLCGTVDSYLIWHLTGGKVHATDPTNAARMLLYNLDRAAWDDDLLRHFNIPRRMLPDVQPTQSEFGEAAVGRHRLPILCSIGDQQASLAGLGGLQSGMVNLNYGTGGFLLVNTGPKRTTIPGLLSSVARSSPRGTTYLVEGTINGIGPLFQWLGEIGALGSDREIDAACARSKERFFLLPALAGLGAPHWDKKIRTTMFGLTAACRRDDLVRAGVEGVAFLMNDIFQALKKSGSVAIRKLVATGGGSRIGYLVQFQADLFGKPIALAEDPESTARGAAFLAGEQGGITDARSFSFSALKQELLPTMGERERRDLTGRWRTTLSLAREWEKGGRP